MRKYLSYLITIVFGLTLGIGSVQAAEMQEIELTNGNVISGEIVSLEKGLYTVNTETLGQLYIQAYKVRSIRKKNGSSKDTGAQGKSNQQGTQGKQK